MHGCVIHSCSDCSSLLIEVVRPHTKQVCVRMTVVAAAGQLCMQRAHQAQQCGVVYNAAGPHVTTHFLYGSLGGGMTHAHTTKLTPVP